MASVLGWAQNSTQGTEFWLSFMLNGYKENIYGGWVHNCVMISAKHNCSGTISNPRTGWSEQFTVESARVKIVGIPEEQAYNEEDEVVADKGLLLVTTDTVSVYTGSCATNSFDATFILPIESLGSEYIVQTDAQSKIIHEEISNAFGEDHHGARSRSNHFNYFGRWSNVFCKVGIWRGDARPFWLDGESSRWKEDSRV